MRPWSWCCSFFVAPEPVRRGLRLLLHLEADGGDGLLMSARGTSLLWLKVASPVSKAMVVPLMPSMAFNAEVTEAAQWPQRMPLIWMVGMVNSCVLVCD
jgi:hypothetical protein